MILRPFKKIKELKKEIEILKDDNKNLKREKEYYTETSAKLIERLKEYETEKHNCGLWCKGCKNFIEGKVNNMYG